MTFRTTPTAWKISTLEDVARRDGYGLVDGPFGSNLPASEYVPAGVPVIRGSNLSLGEVRFRDDEFVFVPEETAHRLERSLCGPEDIIFTKKGTLGQTGIIPKGHHYSTFLLSSNQMKLSVDRSIADPMFVYYVVSSPTSREKIVRDAEATGVPKTNLAYLRTFPLLLPPLPEQQAIAHILSTLDDKIELNRRMNETLEAMARALFKSWFIDFDPVHAKAERRQPAGMDEATAALFPDGFQESELGPLPVGWKVQRLPYLFDINPPRTLPKGAVAPYLEMANMPTSSARAVQWDEREVGSGMRFMNGDVLVARITPCLENGKTAYIDFLAPGQVAWGSTEYTVFRSKHSIPPEYMYFLARSDDFRTYAIQNMTGTSGRQRVPATCFDTYLAVEPPAGIADAFGVFAGEAIQMMKAHDEQSNTLAHIRDALLPKLLSGAIRVKDAASMVEEVIA